MAQSKSNGICGVIRLWSGFQGAEPLDHLHHLMLFCPAIADNGLLDLQRRIFVYLQSMLLAGKQNHASAVCNGDTRCNIGIKKKLFNGNAVRRKHLYKTAQVIENSFKP